MGTPQSSTRSDVIVLGAGVAGLAAAHDLVEAGLTVRVIEARSRLGGRAYTRTDLAEAPVELGAEFVHTAANPVREVLHAAGIEERRGGSSVNRDEEFRPRLRDLLDEIGQPAEILSAEELLQSFSSDEATHALLAEAFSAQLGREALRRTSAADAIAELTLELEHGGEFMGEHNFRVTAGWDPLVTHLAAGVTIDTDARVERVTTVTDSAVSVEATGPAGTSLYTADQVICTVPLGVLKNGDIQFTPSLPAAKTAAIQSLIMLDILKFVFVFDEDVWDLGFAETRPGLLPSTWWTSTWEGNEHPGNVIVGWALADEARHLLQSAPEAMMAQALESLRSLLGRPDLTPRVATHHSWGADPYARGSYSHVPPGASPAARATLAEPTGGSLFWAGEATAVFRSRTVGGAYATGRRAAAQVLAARSATTTTTAQNEDAR